VTSVGKICDVNPYSFLFQAAGCDITPLKAQLPKEIRGHLMKHLGMDFGVVKRRYEISV